MSFRGGDAKVFEIETQLAPTCAVFLSSAEVGLQLQLLELKCSQVFDSCYYEIIVKAGCLGFILPCF